MASAFTSSQPFCDAVGIHLLVGVQEPLCCISMKGWVRRIFGCCHSVQIRMQCRMYFLPCCLGLHAAVSLPEPCPPCLLGSMKHEACIHFLYSGHSNYFSLPLASSCFTAVYLILPRRLAQSLFESSTQAQPRPCLWWRSLDSTRHAGTCCC